MTPAPRITFLAGSGKFRHMRKLAVVIVAALMLSGCSAKSDSELNTQTLATPSASPSANILDSAIESTASRGTAVLTIAIDSTEFEITGTGSASLANNRGEITWLEQETNESWIDLINSDGTYTFVEGSWFLAPEGTQTPTSGNISPLSDLGRLTSQNDDPLKGTIALTIDSGMNFSDEELVELARVCGMNLEVEVELDSRGLINSINKLFNCPGNERSSVTTLSEFGAPLDLSTPEGAFEVDPNQ